ncbi:MAG: bile acid:sodium symporter family protein [Sedimenticola sp.]
MANIYQIVFPLLLALIMAGMGLSLKLNDFKTLISVPKAILAGLVSQLIFLPLTAYLLLGVFDLQWEFAVGFMLLAACPGAATSNVATHLAKGDLALSVLLTSIASFITVFTIPFIVNFALTSFGGEAASFVLPVGKTMLQIFLLTVFPVAIGMFIRTKWAAFADKMENPVKIFSVVFLLILMAGVVAKDFSTFKMALQSVGTFAITFNVTTMALGFLMATLFALSFKQKITLTIEVGFQNVSLGIVIAMTLLNNAQIAIPSMIYIFFAYVTSGIIIIYRQKQSA